RRTPVTTWPRATPRSPTPGRRGGPTQSRSGPWRTPPVARPARWSPTAAWVVRPSKGPAASEGRAAPPRAPAATGEQRRADRRDRVPPAVGPWPWPAVADRVRRAVTPVTAVTAAWAATDRLRASPPTGVPRASASSAVTVVPVATVASAATRPRTPA